ncbi:MAG: DUF3667 domain-containing protein [Prevotella sp.]|nr:DUF3667 domain-containing protein [Prevotella sp.]
MANQIDNLKEKYKRFREWQQQPYQVKPLSEEKHDCATCGTHYEGNFCPRCGQSEKVGRYSFKTTFLLFLDVWGLGNRGMFRTIRDLFLRPGYMIRDYLKGMQMAYFPPFKLFFLVIALSVLVDSGFNIKGENRLKKAEVLIHVNIRDAMNESDSVLSTAKADAHNQQRFGTLEQIVVDAKKANAKEHVNVNEDSNDVRTSSNEKADKIKQIVNWIIDHQTFVMFVWLLVLSGPLYLFFRHSPAFSDIRYSEFFVAMVYTTNMMNIASTAGGLLCLDTIGVESFCYLLSIIPLKQLSGYSYWRTLLKIIAAFVLLFIAIIVISFTGAIIFGIFYTAG